MANVSNAIKTIDSHPLEATYFNGKSYDEMVATDLTSGDIRNVFKTGLYRTCLEREGTTMLKPYCNATGSYAWAADVIISVQQISDNSAIHIMTDSGYLYFRTVNGTATSYYWEPYSKLGSSGSGDVTEYTDSIFYLYDDNRAEEERWADGAYKFTSTSTQTIKVFGLDDGHAVQHDRNNSSNPTTVYFTRIKSGGCRFYYTYLNNTDDKVHIVVGAAYQSTSDMASYSDTVLGGSSSGGTTYTFAEGTTNGAFQVTPSGGSAQSVKVHGLGAAAYHDVNLAISSSSQNLPTSAAVYTYVENALKSKVDKNGDQSIAGTKNFTGTLQYGGVNVAKYYQFRKYSTTYSYTTVSKGTISIQLSKIIPSNDFVYGATYELYGQILAYATGTGKIYLYSDLWGDTSSTNYYIINTTANARVGSTAFVIPCTSTLSCYKSINFSEFSLRIYGYRRISQ